MTSEPVCESVPIWSNSTGAQPLHGLIRQERGRFSAGIAQVNQQLCTRCGEHRAETTSEAYPAPDARLEEETDSCIESMEQAELLDFIAGVDVAVVEADRFIHV